MSFGLPFLLFHLATSTATGVFTGYQRPGKYSILENATKSSIIENQIESHRMPSIFYSTVLRAPSERVWDEIRDFGKLAHWHPLIVDCEIENNEAPDRVGCIRSFHLEDGSHFRERLVSLNDFKKTFSYAIEDSPLPINNYVATVKLMTVTEENWTFISWSSSFDCPAESESELSMLVESGVYKSGLDELKKILAN